MRKLLVLAGAAVAVVVLALTVPPTTAAASVDGYKIAQRQNVDIPSDGAVYGIDVACGSGYKVLGGGHFLHTPYPDAHVTASRPVDGTNPYWMFRVINNSGSTATLSVFAVCALA